MGNVKTSSYINKSVHIIPKLIPNINRYFIASWAEWSNMVKKIQKSPKIFNKFPKVFKIIQNCPKWSNMVQNGPTLISSFVFQLGLAQPVPLV